MKDERGYEVADRRDPDETDRLIDSTLASHRPLMTDRTGGEDQYRCPNPDCEIHWHGKRFGDCPGSWFFDRDGNPRQGGGEFTEDHTRQRDLPPSSTVERLSRAFGPLPKNPRGVDY